MEACEDTPTCELLATIRGRAQASCEAIFYLRCHPAAEQGCALRVFSHSQCVQRYLIRRATFYAELRHPRQDSQNDLPSKRADCEVTQHRDSIPIRMLHSQSANSGIALLVRL